ncbi:MAG: hypothetical protein PUE68_07080 [Kiritimatiellae bacterium]|nr:hypothetical protein [Kiritimatiellia bacterium]
MDSASAHALSNGAMAKYAYRVLDDEAVPVAHATAHVSFKSYGRPQDDADWIVQTDRTGCFEVSHRVNERFTVEITKPGYYATFDEIFYLGMRSPLPVKDGKWQPYGAVKMVTLKKIRNPCRMAVGTSRTSFRIPAYDQWIGFDLHDFAFTTPYGNGAEQDVLLRFHLERSGKESCLATMDVCFTNHPFAGAYELKKDVSSEMKGPYRALEHYPYKSTFHYAYERHPGKPPVHRELDQTGLLVFRTRTKVDGHGQLVSAHYGKICGRWSFVGPKGMNLDYCCFNPVPNDLNLEDCETISTIRRDHPEREIP